jgi:type VI protein secretion system component VasK
VATFSRADQEGNLDRKIKDIMEAPIKGVSIEPPSPAKKINDAAGAMCQQFSVITNKFPFNPSVQPEVSVAELNDILLPPNGKFWQFYETKLKEHLQRNGTPLPGTPIQFNPQFLNFFKQVVAMSDAFYKGGNEPKLNYSIALTSVDFTLDQTKAQSGSITIDGKVAKLASPPTPFVWTGSPSHAVKFEYNNSPAFNNQSLWAVFRFFVDAEVAGSGGNYSMVWPVRGGQANNRIANAKFQVDLSGAPAVFDKNFLRGLRCIANVGK